MDNKERQDIIIKLAVALGLSSVTSPKVLVNNLDDLVLAYHLGYEDGHQEACDTVSLWYDPREKVR